MNSIDESGDMISNFDRLQQIESKDSRWILGLMSGTSMDGLDIALCEFKGSGRNTLWHLHAFVTIPHSEKYKSRVRNVFARADARAEDILALHQEIAEDHSRKVNDVLKGWGRKPEEIDLLASHGQTVFHAPSHQAGIKYPDRNLTLQLGDGDVMAVRTGIITISDFRQKHIAHGGEGAPLAPYGDILLFTDQQEDRILINIGGIANFTFLPSSGSARSVICSDTGPGNTIMDAFMRFHYSKPYDMDAQLARKGEIHEELLNQLMKHPFFEQPLPRTTGPEVFHLDYLDQVMNEINLTLLAPENVMATLNAFTIRSILHSIHSFVSEDTSIYISGGGAHNPLLLHRMKEKYPKIRIEDTSVLGLDPDAKEAVIFALLANECLYGNPSAYPFMGKNFPQISMGKLSFP